MVERLQNAIGSQWMCSGTVMVTTAITLMMHVRSMELVAERAIDTNHELKVAGLTKLSRLEYATVQLIWIVSAAAGFLQSLALG